MFRRVLGFTQPLVQCAVGLCPPTGREAVHLGPSRRTAAAVISVLHTPAFVVHGAFTFIPGIELFFVVIPKAAVAQSGIATCYGLDGPGIESR
jgi:hypothetical protein